MKQKAPKSLHDELDIAKEYILDMEIMPSMRALWSAGEALDVENVAAYNCAYTPIEDWKDIADTMYILMCGAGVGFSVEHQYTDKLPVVPKTFIHASERLIVEDSREGWASSLEKYLNALTRGSVPLVDYSRVRPAGSPLHTFGGQASGPEPLKELFDFIWKTFDAHRGQYLQPIDVYDIMSYVANTVVAGGTRRSATISFSDLDDYDMMTAKDGEFWKINPNRSLSNNSVIMDSRTLTPQQFEDEWNHLANQKSGERGIVFKDRLAEDAVSIGREYREDYRLNPCGEVILRPRQFCNLSEVIVRPYDTKRTLKAKVAFATLLGTLQSTLTDFHFIKDDWKKNSEEERLLGVSLTGLKDHPILQKESSESRRILASLRSTATKWSKVYAHELGINEPASVTSVKPSGTVSQLVNSSSGLHPRWSKYYKRRVENSKDHPLSKWLIDQGVEYEESMYRDSSYVFTFYIEAPDAIFSGDESALEQVKYWKMLKTMYTTHNPSVTILVRPHEWEDLGLWVYNNKPSGMSFLPLDDTVYDQSPFEAISKQEYDLKKSQQPKLDFSIPILEFKDTGKAAGEQGCSGGSCVFGE
jgi:ribonucleoside-diphosphate reductase alpha chain